MAIGDRAGASGQLGEVLAARDPGIHPRVPCGYRGRPDRACRVDDAFGPAPAATRGTAEGRGPTVSLASRARLHVLSLPGTASRDYRPAAVVAPHGGEAARALGAAGFPDRRRAAGGPGGVRTRDPRPLDAAPVLGPVRLPRDEPGGDLRGRGNVSDRSLGY